MRTRSLLGLICVLCGPAAALADPSPEPPVLSDAALLAYAAQPFDKAAMMERRIVIGRHRGVPVAADFPCSDLCPAYTTRIIHYDVAPGPPCDAVGGVTQLRQIPFSIGTREEAFCIPKPLATAG